jgi:hypothetical protein
MIPSAWGNPLYPVLVVDTRSRGRSWRDELTLVGIANVNAGAFGPDLRVIRLGG